MTGSYTRREFLRRSAAGAAGAALAKLEAEAAEFRPPAGKMPTRVLGKTGVKVGLMALGGYSGRGGFSQRRIGRQVHSRLH